MRRSTEADLVSARVLLSKLGSAACSWIGASYSYILVPGIGALVSG